MRLPALLLATALFAHQGVSQNLLANPSFEDALNGWFAFGNTYPEQPNPPQFVPRTGSGVVSIFGVFSGSFNVSGVFQEFAAAPGDTFTLDAWSRQWDMDRLTGSGAPVDNWVVMKIAFFDAAGTEIGGVEQTIMDGTFPTNTWIDNPAVTGTAPTGTIAVQALILYLQPALAGGAVHVDDVTFLGPGGVGPTRVRDLYSNNGPTGADFLFESNVPSNTQAGVLLLGLLLPGGAVPTPFGDLHVTPQVQVPMTIAGDKATIGPFRIPAGQVWSSAFGYQAAFLGTGGNVFLSEPNEWQQYYGAYTPNAAEWALILGQNQVEVDAVQEASWRAAAAQRRVYPTLSGHNDVADAFRHALWSCEMVRIVGGPPAQLWADAREVDSPSREMAMDLFNDQVGRDLALQPETVLGGTRTQWTGRGSEVLVQEAIRLGRLQIQP
ncbi:MAG: hypothetical protein H6834_05400 [Planctomycetes bacterium]|nr:hypothetical protein [Planctomycetota bacterium]